MRANPPSGSPDPRSGGAPRRGSLELRCLVCQNQSIDESNADLAHDLRALLRQRLTAGDTDRQVLDYVVARYGGFVLLDPPPAAAPPGFERGRTCPCGGIARRTGMIWF